MWAGSRRTYLTVVAILLISIGVEPAAAQQPVADVLSFLLTNQAVATGDFVKDAQSAAVTRDTIFRLLLIELTTLPLSSSSAGFAYRFNPALGTVERTSNSFAPFFAERSLTAGRTQISIGLTFQAASYKSLDGHNLGDGTFVTTANQFKDEAQPFDVEALTLALQTRTATLYGNLGITDRLDVGLALPMVSLSLEGSRVNTYRGSRFLQADAVATAQGLGDLAVRSKMRLTGSNRTGVTAAVAGELRLPTGRKENLLGTGEPSFRLLAIGSVEPGRVALDFNGGFTIGLVDQWEYRIAASLSPSARLTTVGELLGRRVAGVGAITEVRAPHPTIQGAETLRLETIGASTSTLAVVAGIKWNLGGTWLLNANTSWPLTDRGLRSGVVTRIGVDYAFGL
jgi:Putative MetA-pathway of phenol degradation